MVHFKRARPGTEPGSVPGSVRRLFTRIGAGHRANSIINMAALNLRHVVRVLVGFLRFNDDVTEWSVCCDYEIVT